MLSHIVLESKQKAVDALSAELSQAQSIVFADYRGLTVAEDTALRTAMREAQVTYRVVKNSITTRALQKAGLEAQDEVLIGPTSIAYSTEELIAPARVLKTFERKFKPLEIKGGYVEGRTASLDEINRLATIPEPQVLYGQLVYTLLSPVSKLAFVLNAIKEDQEKEADEPQAQEEAAAQDA